MADNNNPLTEQHCQTLDCVLRQIAQTKDLIARCKACGIDVSHVEAANNRQEQQAHALKAHFFPYNH